MRTLQELMGHRNLETTLIYADYAPSGQELAWAEAAFTPRESAADDRNVLDPGRKPALLGPAWSRLAGDSHQRGMDPVQRASAQVLAISGMLLPYGGSRRAFAPGRSTGRARRGVRAA